MNSKGRKGNRNSRTLHSGKVRGRSSRRHSSRRRWSWWGLLAGAFLMAATYIALSYYFFVTPLSFRWRAIYGEPDYPAGYDVMGIDISHHQSRINWDVLRNSRIGDHPISFVFIKATEGATLIDENFNENFYRSRENSIVRGAYHFFKANTDAASQAEFYLRQVHLDDGDLRPVLDVEERGSKPLKAFQSDVLAWLTAVEKAYDVPPIIYTGYKFKVDFLSAQAFDRYPLWIAHYYTKELKYQGQWHFWQYTDCGRLDGIRGTVDFNLFNGDVRQLMQLTIKK